MLDQATHTYTGIISKKPGLVSVTTMLAEEGYLSKQFYREGRQELGTQCHKMLDAYDKGYKFSAPDIYLRYLEPYKNFLSHTGIRIVGSEIEIELPICGGCAGTLDKLCFDPKAGHGIIDVKFSQCGWIFWHEAQTEFYRQGLLFHPEYKDLDIKWRGGLIFGNECQMPKFIPHNRVPDISKICQSIMVSNSVKHRYKIGIPEITSEEGYW